MGHYNNVTLPEYNKKLEEWKANAIEAAKVDAIAESNAIAERARRDQWKQEAIRTVQRHNTNKHLKNMGKH